MTEHPTDQTVVEATHRLFVSCPVPADAASKLANWAAESLTGPDVRVVEPDKMHVTLMFFPKATAELKDRLSGLMEEVEWVPFEASASSLSLHRRSSIVAALKIPSDQLESLHNRLGRTSLHTDSLESPSVAEWRRHWSRPLALMNLEQDQPEMEHERRRDRQRQPLALHVTLARVSKHWNVETPLPDMPTVNFVLDRVALFESTLSADGATYTQISAPVED